MHINPRPFEDRFEDAHSSLHTGNAHTGDVVTPPSMSGRWVKLRAVYPRDYEFLYGLSADVGGFRWRFRAGQPNFEDFVRGIGQGVLCQWMVFSLDGQSPLGLVVCYNADFRSRHAYIAIQGIPDGIAKGWILEAAALLIDYLFVCYDFEKLYAESPGFVFESFKSGLGDAFEEEGCLKKHDYFFGRFWDLHILSYTREKWLQTQASRVVRPRSAKPCSNTFDVADISSLIVEEFDLEADSLNGATRLTADLGFDSIQLLELVCIIEDRYGLVLEMEQLQSLLTIDDIYAQCLLSRDRA